MTEHYFTKSVDYGYEDAISRTTEALAHEGFGIMTTIDIAAQMKAKLGADMKPYMILGACHPPSAYAALQTENKIGVMLPCNVIVQDVGEGKIEVSTINPMASIASIESDKLVAIATEVAGKLKVVLSNL